MAQGVCVLGFDSQMHVACVLVVMLHPQYFHAAPFVAR